MTSEAFVPAHLKSTFPVSFPSHPALIYNWNQFEAFLQDDLIRYQRPDLTKIDFSLPIRELTFPAAAASEDTTSIPTVAAKDEASSPSWADIVKTGLDTRSLGKTTDTSGGFVQGLLKHDISKPLLLPSNKMLTENGDVANRSSGSAAVDLFYELEDVVAQDRLHQLLQASWDETDALTLKIIFNARSIHLGKSSRRVFYRCLDWLSTHHPVTCIMSLQWLPRPIIEKKIEKQDGEEELVFVEAEKSEDDSTRYDVRNGVAHGYYKDLLNILALAVNHKLNDPKTILNVHRKKRNLEFDTAEAAKLRHVERRSRHENALKAFYNDPFYRGLHLMVARIFAEQLKADLKLFASGDKKALRHISLCAKWAPSSKLFHDKHTFVVSTIAELLHSQDEFKDAKDREEYLRHAREAYRKDVSTLRKVLQVVERDISAKTFQNIKYDRIPSQAMFNYSKLFVEKDEARFLAYLDHVVKGTKTISGATLLPSTLVKTARSLTVSTTDYIPNADLARLSRNKPSKTLAQKRADADVKVVDSQWKTLVQRIKDSGTLESSIAVCDVSASMFGPQFEDGTTPMDSAIGLSLLVAEVCKPPFGGVFITFSTRPSVVELDLSANLSQKVSRMERADWGATTNFVSVFEDLILPMAINNGLKQEDMVKQVFVFSDMHFNQASDRHYTLSSAYERLRDMYAANGYEIPQLIFWNLASGRGGCGNGWNGAAPKPVTVDDNGTALVSGYSQGMLKVFLDNGAFDEIAEEKEEAELVEKVETTDSGDEVTVVHQIKKRKLDPLITVKKAVNHKAYDMFKVVD